MAAEMNQVTLLSLPHGAPNKCTKRSAASGGTTGKTSLLRKSEPSLSRSGLAPPSLDSSLPVERGNEGKERREESRQHNRERQAEGRT